MEHRAEVTKEADHDPEPHGSTIAAGASGVPGKFQRFAKDGDAAWTRLARPSGIVERRMELIVVAVLFLLLLYVLRATRRRDGPFFYPIKEDDAEMAAATARAREELPAFIERLVHPQAGDEDFSVKAPLTDGRNTEHFWLDNVQFSEGVFSGTLDNTPQIVDGHDAGLRVSIPAGEISDWMCVHEGRLIGGYTIRLVYQRLDPESRRKMQAVVKFRFE
jgi:uncharacterized protein YegJ (DUF2314 family)